MFTDLGGFVQTASAVLVIAALAGLGLMRARVVDLKERLTECREEIADQDREIAKLKAGRAEDKAEIAKQANDIDTLRRTVTGEAHWEELTGKLDHHHAEAKSHWAAFEELLGRILQALRRPQ